MYTDFYAQMKNLSTLLAEVVEYTDCTIIKDYY